jgi:hypothetical protein
MRRRRIEKSIAVGDLLDTRSETQKRLLKKLDGETGRDRVVDDRELNMQAIYTVGKGVLKATGRLTEKTRDKDIVFLGYWLLYGKQH